MTLSALPQTRCLLLVEDNPADADLVEELLEQDKENSERFEIVRSTRLSDAIEKLRSRHVDVVLLDLRLPDGAGVESVRSLRAIDQQIPIVVLTGSNDEHLATLCISAGAQDYLCKDEIRPTPLRRSLGYAISRLRESQLRELSETLAGFRSLSSQNSRTSVTAALAGTGAVRVRYPGVFAENVQAYAQLLLNYGEDITYRPSRPREAMERIVTALGDSGAGPRDLIDVHITALDQTIAAARGKRTNAILYEGRLLALEMMGLLVDYYRVGLRRQRPGRTKL